VERKNVLVYGYGNPGRQDDGIGPVLAQKLSALNIPHVSADSNYQLNIEDAYDIAQYEAVFFADASADCGEPFAFERIFPSAEIRFTTHSITPDSLMALCHELYGIEIPAYTMAVRGYAWEFNEPMTAEAESNMEKAFNFLAESLMKYRSAVMADKKVLIIDDDPDILEAAKIVLNAGGFNTVTAAGGEEGLDVFKNEKPDLVLCDMMMESVDAGAFVASEIRKRDKNLPIFLISSIGDATSVTMDVSSLGFTGVFQKPFEPKALISLVKKALSA
jgi:hydrogenase maturation protease